MIELGRRKELLVEAEHIAQELARFSTPGSGDAVDPARLAEVARYLASGGSLPDVGDFLKLLPGSFHRKLSQSAGPQLHEVARVVGPAARRARSAEELLFVLGWARRLLHTMESGVAEVAPRGRAPGRGPGPRGGGNRWRR